MKALLTIGAKDLRILFGDRVALLLMLGAPLLLALGMGLVSGAFSGAPAAGPARIPLAIANEDAGAVGRQIEQRPTAPELQPMLQPLAGPPLVSIARQGTTVSTPEVTIMSYLAPAFAVLFLMYTVTQGGRSILAEREEGTLAPLLRAPVTAPQVLSGKITGIFLSGLAQMGILMLASSLLFDLHWGAPLAVAVRWSMFYPQSAPSS